MNIIFDETNFWDFAVALVKSAALVFTVVGGGLILTHQINLDDKDEEVEKA